MKSLFAIPAGRSIRACLAAGLLAFLAACATGVQGPRHETDEQVLEQLQDGKAVLDCTEACADAWRRDRSDLMARYSAGDWRELAALVIQTDYRQDLAYFYLGRAAEGLGANSAALEYYRTAESLATGTIEGAKCAATPEGCNGLSLLTEVLLRIQVVEAARNQSFAATHRQQHRRPNPGQPESAQPETAQPAPAQPAGAPAQPPADNWIDPPPASH
jgi:hypothetical protein